jgi:ABC-2 type transport system ATP-binding protein
MASDSVLSLRDVTIRYGSAVAVDALSLEVAAGEIFALLGPNGSGKSSTLLSVAGVLAPAAGTIRVCGIDPASRPLEYRRRFGIVPQELALYEDLSGEANLRFFGKLYGLRGRELEGRVEATLELVRLTDQARRPARTYSGGMQRRLNLACALLHQPALLLLDEPTIGLDLASREAVFACLRTMRERGCAIVYTTHHLQDVELLCDRAGIMDRGRLIALGTLRQLLALPGQPHQRLRLDAAHVGLERVFVQVTERSRRES